MNSKDLGVWRTFEVVACFVGCLFFLAGCSGSKVRSQASPELPRYQVKTIALVPFTAMTTPQFRDTGDQRMSTPESVKRSDISIAIPPSAEEHFRQTVTVPGYAAEKITQLFWNRLRNRTDITVLSPYDIAKSDDIQAIAGMVTSPEALAAALAKKTHADVAMVGRVLVYQERVGSRLGANPPAAVGFEVKAIAPDGRVLWIGNFYERQQPMTEDFFGFLRRWAFVTAEELARDGVDGLIKEFPF